MNKTERNVVNAAVMLSETENDWHITMGYDMAIAFARNVTEYNNMDRRKLTKLLNEIDQIIPRTFYSKNNPNNGSRQYTIQIGNNGSLEIIYNIKRSAIEDTKKFARTLELLGIEAQADEKNVVAGRYATTWNYRFWWD